MKSSNIRAAISSIRMNTNGMRSDFESAVATLLPVCPYSQYRSNSNNTINRKANVSDTTLKGKSESKTGVEFRWYKKSEYDKLTPRSEMIRNCLRYCEIFSNVRGGFGSLMSVDKFWVVGTASKGT